VPWKNVIAVWWATFRLAFEDIEYRTANMKYRQDARTCVTRAKVELETMDEQRLKYAALELRFALEALTYERAASFEEDLPPSDYEVWQPTRLMQQVLEIDENADKDSSISFGLESEYGVPSKEMRHLGDEKVLSFKTIKKHYDALGSYLHTPILKQQRKGGIDHQKLRDRCRAIVEYLDPILKSPVFNVHFTVSAHMGCECGHMIKRRMPEGVEETTARCMDCGLTYTIRDTGNGTVSWTLDVTEIPCPDPECSGMAGVASSQIKLGKFWNCGTCGQKITVGLAVSCEPVVEADTETHPAENIGA
jgi:hypothetical protein